MFGADVDVSVVTVHLQKCHQIKVLLVDTPDEPQASLHFCDGVFWFVIGGASDPLFQPFSFIFKFMHDLKHFLVPNLLEVLPLFKVVKESSQAIVSLRTHVHISE